MSGCRFGAVQVAFDFEIEGSFRGLRTGKADIL